MSNSNDFKPFAIATGANVLSPSTWAADPALSVGFQVGQASSTKTNTAIRQASSIAAMIAQFTADNGPGNVQDNGNIATLESQFEAALIQYLGSFYQKILLTNTTFYIDQAIGSDTLYDGTSDTISGSHGPWATIAHAKTVMATLNLNGNIATIQLANPGTYPSPATGIAAPGNGTLIIRGDPLNSSSYVLSGSPSAPNAVLGISSGTIQLVGMTISNSGATGSGISVINASLTLNNIIFDGATTTAYHIEVFPSGSVVIQAGCSFTKSAGCAMFIDGGSITQTANMSVSGSPAWSIACCQALNGGFFVFGAPGGYTFTGSATGPRYNATFNGVINTGGSGANYFPGSSAGSTATGGQYG